MKKRETRAADTAAKLRIDVMLHGRYVHTLRYAPARGGRLSESELRRFVTDRLPSLRGKPFEIAFDIQKL